MHKRKFWAPHHKEGTKGLEHVQGREKGAGAPGAPKGGITFLKYKYLRKLKKIIYYIKIII